MVQMINISQARSNLSSLAKQVAKTKKPIIIIRESSPIAVLSPYEETKQYDPEKYLEKILSIGTWDLTKDYKQVRKEVNKRFAKQSL